MIDGESLANYVARGIAILCVIVGLCAAVAGAGIVLIVWWLS